MDTQVHQRELNVFEIVGEGLRIFGFKFREIGLIALVSIIPIEILTVLVSLVSFPRSLPISFVGVVFLFLLRILAALVFLLAAMSIAIITEGVINHKNITASDAVRQAYSKWGAAITTSLLAGIILFGLTLLLIVPGIIFGTYYCFVLSAVALRGQKGGEALGYSKKLVQGQWWRVFGILLGLGIMVAVITLASTFAFLGVSHNPYFVILPATIASLLAIVYLVVQVVLFLNNDFVYHHRLAGRGGRAEASRPKPASKRSVPKRSKAPARTSRPSKGIRTTRRPAKKTTSRKRSSSSRSK